MKRNELRTVLDQEDFDWFLIHLADKADYIVDDGLEQLEGIALGGCFFPLAALPSLVALLRELQAGYDGPPVSIH